MMKYLVFLLVLAGCKPVDNKPRRPVPTIPMVNGTWVIIAAAAGFLIGDWLRVRKMNEKIKEVEKLKGDADKVTAETDIWLRFYQERIEAMNERIIELKQMVERYRNDRRY